MGAITLTASGRFPVRSYVHNRYHVTSSLYGLMCTFARKHDAINYLRRHLDALSVHEDNDTLHVFDSMHRSGARIVYGGRIHNRIKSHGLGVAFDVNTGKAVA